MLLLVSVKQVTNFMVAVKEPVVVFETKDGGFLFGNYLFFHYDRKSSTPYMSVEMRSGLYPQSLTQQKTQDGHSAMLTQQKTHAN